MKDSRKFFGLLVVVAILTMTMTAPVLAAKPVSCATIQGGTITDANGNVITTGFDQYGYNYQAHMFNGWYDNNARPAVLVTSGDWLIMKWSDEWISNLDCNHDGKLDRGLVDGVSTGTSMGWLTNHVQGTYDLAGQTQRYTDFVKIQYTGSGSPLWGSYTLVQEVYNDSGTGDHGLLYKADPGLGH